MLYMILCFSQEVDELGLCGHEPIPTEADPEPSHIPPGEGPSGAHRAGSHPSDLPAGERHHPGRQHTHQ